MVHKIIAAALMCALPAHAALYPRDLDPGRPGHEAVYDSTRGITWDANSNSFYGTWAEVQAAAAASEWRIATGEELYGLYWDWVGAGNFFFSDAPADAGMGSSLFGGNHRGGSWWTGSGEYTDFTRRYTDGSGGCENTSYPCISSAWAVRDGDVGVAIGIVPEPETYLLMLAGLGALLSRLRRHVCSLAPMSTAAPCGRVAP